VTQAFHTFLMTGRYPLAVIKIELAPEDVDVNVHPAKTQVRFRDGDAVFRAVQRAVRRALLDQTVVPESHTSTPVTDATDSLIPHSEAEQREDASWPGGWPTPEQMIRRARLRALGSPSAQHFGRHPDPQAVQFALDLNRATTDVTNLDDFHPEPGSSHPEDQPTSQPTNQPTTKPTHQLPFLRVVGQLGLTYVVAEGPEGMFLIDQHAAHERVLYEKFMAEKTRAQVASQAFLEPMTVELTAEGASLVEENLETLLVLGFDMEPFGSHTALVRAVPATLVDDDVQALFNEMVADLQVGDEPLADEIEARIVRRVCKRAAIKGGQPLSQPEMMELIRQLEACASPRTCPHGRPTMIHLSAEQLAKEFGRLG
jgi:DNA mismatch repair protein MutL